MRRNATSTWLRSRLRRGPRRARARLLQVQVRAGQKQKQARKHQQQITIARSSCARKIAQHDYETKKGHVERFLRHKDKVKITIMFRGREVTHPERGIQLLDRIADELAEYGVVEQRPLHEGRNMTMMLGPSKAVLSGHFDKGANGSGNGAAPDDALVEVAAEPVSGNGASPTEDVAAAPEPVAEPAASVPEPAASVPEPAASVPEPVVEPAASTPSRSPKPRRRRSQRRPRHERHRRAPSRRAPSRRAQSGEREGGERQAGDQAGSEASQHRLEDEAEQRLLSFGRRPVAAAPL